MVTFGYVLNVLSLTDTRESFQIRRHAAEDRRRAMDEKPGREVAQWRPVARHRVYLAGYRDDVRANGADHPAGLHGIVSVQFRYHHGHLRAFHVAPR